MLNMNDIQTHTVTPVPLAAADLPARWQVPPVSTAGREDAPALAAYLVEVETIAPLTLEEEQRLGEQIRLAQRGLLPREVEAQAKERLITGSLHRVVILAKSVRATHPGYRVQLLDLIQEGNVALIRAVSRYEHIAPGKFCMYASRAIRAELLDTLSLAWPIRLPPTSLKQARQRGLMDALCAMQPLSLDRALPWSEDEDSALLDALAIPSIPVDRQAQEAKQQQVDTWLAQLPEREQAVLRLRYGLDEADQRVHSYQAIAARLHLCDKTIRATELRGLCMLRTLSQGEPLPEQPAQLSPPERIALAYAELVATNAPLTVQALARQAHIDNRLCLAWAREHPDLFPAPRRDGQTRHKQLERAYQQLLAAGERVNGRALAQATGFSRKSATRWLTERTGGYRERERRAREARLTRAYGQLQQERAGAVPVDLLRERAGVGRRAAHAFVREQARATTH